jgi:hypothetical protein
MSDFPGLSQFSILLLWSFFKSKKKLYFVILLTLKPCDFSSSLHPFVFFCAVAGIAAAQNVICTTHFNGAVKIRRIPCNKMEVGSSTILA